MLTLQNVEIAWWFLGISNNGHACVEKCNRANSI